MTHLMKRLTAAVLASLTLPGLASCAKEDVPDAPVTGDPTVTAAPDTDTTDPGNGETARADRRDSLPDSLNLNGETITILARNTPNVLNYDVIGTDNTGDLVFDAVWERNSKVKERLNVSLNVIPSQSTGLNDLKKEIQQVVMSGAGDYDMFITSNNSIIQFGMVEYLRTFQEAPYLDLNAPWWWTESMLNLSPDGNTIQYLIGDMLLNNLLTSAVVYANKEIWEDHFGDPDALYQMVLDGKWTLDTFAEYSRQVYTDVNGSGTLDDGDIVGFYGNEYQTIDYFAAGSDVFFFTRGEDGCVALKPPDERAVTLTEKLINLFYNESAAVIAAGSNEANMVPAFVEGKCLFLPDVLLSSTKAAMRDMKADYAILPVPKFDEEQTGYKTIVYGHSTNASVPVTVSDERFASVCAVLEALCAEGYRSVTEKCYEVALKTKYARDANSAKMIDLIVDSSCKDFCNEYANRLAYVNNTLHTAVAQKNMVVMSVYESTAKKAESGLSALLADLKKINP
ncbi:MAG: hypothetical protein ACI3XP_01740 [Eubacteriales bacterium]